MIGGFLCLLGPAKRAQAGNSKVGSGAGTEKKPLTKEGLRISGDREVKFAPPEGKNQSSRGFVSRIVDNGVGHIRSFR